jgi:hypothetical protein
VGELTGINTRRLTKDNLYKISHLLYSQKAGLEDYLSQRTNDLFNLEDRIILYDLTNTYFLSKALDKKYYLKYIIIQSCLKTYADYL